MSFLEIKSDGYSFLVPNPVTLKNSRSPFSEHGKPHVRIVSNVFVSFDFSLIVMDEELNFEIGPGTEQSHSYSMFKFFKRNDLVFQGSRIILVKKSKDKQ